jgi:putative restriction endonuclease
VETLNKYFLAFRRLHIDRSHGQAPHKPILLLTILQLYRNKLIQDNCIFLTPELIALFNSTWSVLVSTRHDCRISYPFYYLKSDKFWKLIPNPGFDNVNQMGSVMKSFSSLNAAVDHAEIENDLFSLMQDVHSNLLLQHFLLDEYFPESQKKYLSRDYISTDLFTLIEEKILYEDPVLYKEESQRLIEEKDEEEIFLRGSVFKREIPKVYNYTCCISGMRITSVSNISMIDACHIIPFSQSYDDTITNGIALCPNLHRAFDRGLITIDKNYRVRVSSNFSEESNKYSLKDFDGQRILLPADNKFYPVLDKLEWHRVNRFERIQSR